jgi:hypothetical protein
MNLKELFDKRKEKGIFVSVKVPLGVNPFRDLWDALMRKSEKSRRARWGKP